MAWRKQKSQPQQQPEQKQVTVLQAGDEARTRVGGETVLVGDPLAEGGQGRVFRAQVNGQPFAVKWYRPSADPSYDTQRVAGLAALVERGRPEHPSFIWPIGMVECTKRAGFGYLMPLLDERFISFVQMMKAPQPPGFATLITAGLNLVDAIASLHTSGLCYRDISFGNLYVDKASGDIAVIDNDNIGVSGSDTTVLGTPQFMAPEVIRREMPPSTETDLYSLAVFLFYLFCFGHPLEGAAVEASYSWDDDRRISEEELLLKHYGKDPVFIFDPDNPGNRPLPGSPAANWWPIYPRFFRNLFVRSFTTGLADSSLTGRLTEGIWRRGLRRLTDCLWVCGDCQASIFFDPDDPDHSCWSCGAVPDPPMLLSVPGHAIVLTEGAVLTTRHLKLPGRADYPIAVAESDPRYPDAILLRNVSRGAWSVEPDGEEPKQVKPGKRLMVRSMTMSVAGKRAVIQPAGEKHGTTFVA